MELLDIEAFRSILNGIFSDKITKIFSDKIYKSEFNLEIGISFEKIFEYFQKTKKFTCIQPLITNILEAGFNIKYR